MTDSTQSQPGENPSPQITLESAKAILDTLPNIAVLLTRKGLVSHYNPTFAALSGWPLNEGLGKTWFDHFLPARDREDIRRLFSGAVAGRQTKGNQSTILVRDGTERLIEWTDNLLRIGSEAEPLLLAVGTDVTDRVAADAVLRDESHKLRAVIDCLHIAVGLYTTDGVLIECNDRPLQDAGLSRADVVGLPFWETAWWTYSADEQDRLRQSMARAARGERVQYHSRPMMAQGQIADLDMVLAPLVNTAGQIEMVVGAGINIGARLTVEQQLEAKSSRLEEAQRLANIGSWELNLISGDLSWSRQTYEIFRRDPASGPDSYAGFLATIHPDDRDSVDGAYLDSLKTRQPYQITHRLKFVDGDEKWVEERCQTNFSPEGEPLLSTGTVQDVTDRVLAERALAASEATLSAILTASPEAIIISDNQARIVMFSDGAEAQFGCRREDVIGQSIGLLVEPAQAAKLAEEFWSLAKDNSTQPGKMTTQTVNARRANGAIFPADISIAGIGTGGEQRISIIARDASGRLAREQDLLSALQKAEAAAEAKTAFLATMSHEIRTPLNAMLGMTSMLGLSPLDDRQREMVDVSLQAGQQLLALLNDILEYSRLEHGTVELERKAFNLDEVLKNARDVNAFRAAENGVDLVFNSTIPTGCAFVGDAKKLLQILNNLIGNAVKFSPGGRVVASARHTVSGAEAGLTICVADTGIGMSPSDIERIFDRFTQLDMSNTRKFGGAGLGLSIVKGLLAQMDGEIRVESRPGSGSEFFVRIPLDLVPVEARPVAAAPLSLPRIPANLRVLLAEDNQLNALTLKLMLEDLGCSVVVAHNGPAAIRAFAAASFDMVLLDIQMPELDGLQSLELMRPYASARSEAPHFLACTANAGPKQVESYIQAGFETVIVKPVSINELALHLQRLDRVPDHG